MLPILALLGIGLAVGIVSAIGDDDNDDVTVTSEEFADDDDAVFSSDFRDELEAEADSLVTEGELTRAEADAFLAQATFLNGPLDIGLGGGNDTGVGSNLADTIVAGDGDDLVQGRDGDDRIELGDGLDTSGIDQRTAGFPDDLRPFSAQSESTSTEAELEGGDDTILGGSGDDDIADGFGSNLIEGNQGNDFLVGVDQDSLTPDTIKGGFGADAIFADEGDLVSTGPETDRAADRVTIDLNAGVETGYSVVTIEDFDAARDSIELEGASNLLEPNQDDPVTVTDDGTDTFISVDGVPVVRVAGVLGIDRADLSISTV